MSAFSWNTNTITNKRIKNMCITALLSAADLRRTATASRPLHTGTLPLRPDQMFA